ncbi:zinc-dependent metalloprotease [Flavobacterium turcicum]|uniref:Zinc-dependent metalloprotease n=1 Tax=Flavobacterium turcicum TaxID=2764718 RepID=A0ABR7JFR4_9FLAO|nr:zinc-dependent metalloprotease [Flavobacterium turcicum]MBC5863325.1 zinc-dependent metalloprotease [Flavobacterium turcicum]NHL02057.1 zinc-dependent metalloprotease [Flavobacterium turcicum]
MIQKKLTLLMLCLLSFSATETFAQSKKKKKNDKTAVAAPMAKPAEGKKEPKPYKKVIDSTAVTQKGLIDVHKTDNKYLFEIPDSLLGGEIMTITRYSKTPAGGGIFGGEEINRQVIRFEKGPNNNILMRSVTYVIMSPDQDKPLAQAVKNSTADPIIGNFDVLAYKKDNDGKITGYVIDMTTTFDADVQTFSLDPIKKQLLNIQTFQKDRSYISKISSFPINTEIRTVKTFTTTPPRISTTPTPQIGVNLPSALDAGVVTVEMNTSMILLPKTPMRKREFDARVGYFANEYGVFEEESQKSDTKTFAVRWRLEPKSPEDAAKQKKGELIEPLKPIVYYIDPATPDKWKKFIKQGIDDWQVAFEAAGWKNAIRGEYWPENDPTMSLEDARFSVLRYFAAEIQNAYGPNVHDPRSGEILESHIGWYHNIMSLLRNWYLIQTAAVDPAARKKQFDDSLMGELIRFVSSHEVGHTLGLRHNMGASSATPVEKLRDAAYQEKNGHTSSIMDYARFNYVAQPEDNVKHLFPRIGDYDKWAIKWGYSYFEDAKTEAEEKAVLNNMTKEAYKNNRLWFGTESSPYDPRYQTEDIGDNAMRASEYGIKNLKRILPNLITWSKEDGESYAELDELYGALTGQFRRYLGHVTKNVGGIYDNPKTYDMTGNQFQVVPKSIQKDAISFLNTQLFNTPKWLLDQNVLSKINPDSGVEAIKAMQDATLSSLMAGDRMVRLMETSVASKDNYSADEMVTDLKKGIFSELKSNGAIDMYRRNIQKIYVDKLIELLKPGSTTVRSNVVGATYGFNTRRVNLAQTDLPSIARGQLVALKNELKIASGQMTDRLSKYHTQDLISRISEALDPK